MDQTAQPVADLLAAYIAGDETVVPMASIIDPEADTRARIKAARADYWAKICPDDFKASNWDHPGLVPYHRQITAVLSWKPGGKGLLLSGATGHGKTRTLWALLKRLMCVDGLDCAVWKSNDWFSALQRNLSYGRDDAAGFVRACARRPIMAIDDLGQEAIVGSREDWAMAWLFDLLDERLANKRPLIVTTNVSADQIAGVADEKDKAIKKAAIRGEPLVRRLLDLCDVVKF